MVPATGDNPRHQVTLSKLTFHLFPWKIQPTIYMSMSTRLRKVRQLGGEGGGGGCELSHLSRYMYCRVTVAGGTTFSHTNVWLGYLGREGWNMKYVRMLIYRAMCFRSAETEHAIEKNVGMQRKMVVDHWSEMVKSLIDCIQEFKSTRKFNSVDFNSDKVKL